MANEKISGAEILNLGFAQGKVIGIALEAMQSKQYRTKSRKKKLDVLADVLTRPADYINDEVLGRIAAELIRKEKSDAEKPILREESIDYPIFGREHIDESAIQQMNVAMRLPVAVQGALMPDAHYGYGLPIGGVLAAENAVIPYGVGVDIGCRMCLTIYDIPVASLERDKHQYKKHLIANTRFGNREVFKRPLDD